MLTSIKGAQGINKPWANRARTEAAQAARSAPAALASSTGAAAAAQAARSVPTDTARPSKDAEKAHTSWKQGEAEEPRSSKASSGELEWNWWYPPPE